MAENTLGKLGTNVPLIPPDSELPLMYQAGSAPLEEWNGKSWATPTSMRNVDAGCEANIIRRYLLSEEEE